MSSRSASCRIVVLPLTVGTCQVTVSHFSVFLNIQICAVFGPDKLSEHGWIGSLTRRVDCFDGIPALKKFTGAIYALLYNVTMS